MLVSQQNVPAELARQESISILLVSAHYDDLSALRNILHHRDWNLNHCSSVREAHGALEGTSHAIVLTERDLPDGSWTDVLGLAERQPAPPRVLVMSRHADEKLWAEVLNLGGYDVLLKPFDRSEVTNVVGMAWRCWMGSLRRRTATVAAGSAVLSIGYLTA